MASHHGIAWTAANVATYTFVYTDCRALTTCKQHTAVSCSATRQPNILTPPAQRFASTAHAATPLQPHVGTAELQSTSASDTAAGQIPMTVSTAGQESSLHNGILGHRHGMAVYTAQDAPQRKGIKATASCKKATGNCLTSHSVSSHILADMLVLVLQPRCLLFDQGIQLTPMHGQLGGHQEVKACLVPAGLVQQAAHVRCRAAEQRQVLLHLQQYKHGKAQQTPGLS